MAHSAKWMGVVMKFPLRSLTKVAGAVGALALGLIGAISAHAQINSPVPSSAYIVYNGLDWAWGGPCPYSGGCYATGDLTYQGTQGWSLPSAADMAMVDALDSSNPSAFANLFLNNPGGNVPAGGADPVSGATFFDGTNSATASCATPYFSGAAYWCDAGNGQSGLWAGSAIAAGSGDAYYAEQLYVRGAVPEPATWAMLILGVAMIGFAVRRRSEGAALAA